MECSALVALVAVTQVLAATLSRLKRRIVIRTPLRGSRGSEWVAADVGRGLAAHGCCGTYG